MYFGISQVYRTKCNSSIDVFDILPFIFGSQGFGTSPARNHHFHSVTFRWCDAILALKNGKTDRYVSAHKNTNTSDYCHQFISSSMDCDEVTGERKIYIWSTNKLRLRHSRRTSQNRLVIDGARRERSFSRTLHWFPWKIKGIFDFRLPSDNT